MVTMQRKMPHTGHVFYLRWNFSSEMVETQFNGDKIGEIANLGGDAPIQGVVYEYKPGESGKGLKVKILKCTFQARIGKAYVGNSCIGMTLNSKPAARTISCPRRKEGLALVIETRFPCQKSLGLLCAF